MFRLLTHLIETQGRVGSLEPGRRILSKWKWGQICEDLERQDREVRLDPERAQVPAKALKLGKLSKLSSWSTNFFSNFAVKTTRIVRARIHLGTPPTPGAR